MKKKIFISVVVFLAVFALASVAKTKASTAQDIFGWIWGGSEDGAGISSGVGWISMNNTNPEIIPAGVVPYNVVIPVTGQITGYAYSENVGAIDFNPHAGCPGSPKYAGACDAYPTAFAQDATRNADNTITGWARFVEIAKANAAGNSGGWTGWIRMDGTNFGVTVGVGADKNLSGNAYSEELGLISFNASLYRAHFPYPPEVTLSSDKLTINLDTTPLPQTAHLTWTTKNATDCNAGTSPDAGLWKDAKALVSSGTGDAIVIDATHRTENFTLTCNGLGGSSFSTVNVTTGCNVKTCGPAGTCDTSLMTTGSADNSPCVAASNCSNDSECAPRQQTQWMEVAP